MRKAAAVVTRYELLLLGLATPLLLFPGAWSPIGLTIIGMTWVSRRLARGRFSPRTALDVPIILVLIMIGVSLIPSVDLDLSLNRACIYILGVALFYGMVNGLHSERRIHLMGVALVLVGSVVALISLVSTDFTIGRIVELPALYDRLPPPLIRGLPGSGVIEAYDLVNPRVVAGALAIILPVPMAYLLLGRGWKLRLASGLTACVMLGVLFLTQSPQGFLGLAAALLLLGCWWSKWILLTIPLGLGALAAIVGNNGVRQGLVASLSAEELDTLAFGMQSRVANGARGLGMIRDMPYTGVGLNTFPVVDGLYSFGRANAEHAHNLLIQTGVDLGIAGVVALVALLAGFGYTVWRIRRTGPQGNQRALLVGICGAVAAWLAYGMLDSITLGHKPAAALWVMLGLSASLRLRLDAPDSRAIPFPSRFSRAWLLAALLPTLALIAFIGFTRDKVFGAFYLNLGVMEAHRALAADSEGDAQDHLHLAEGYMQQALRWDPARARTRTLLEWVLGGDIDTTRWPRETAG
ncbi:MAG TPA: O-antigen ligase family protein, partial [Anaerolineae bacterium]|nr:O-antigen ligase family protein [Anaerolineae bacterium]